MAIQSSFFPITGTNITTFTSTKHIPTKQHMAVWKQSALDDSWSQIANEEFDLITNSAVLKDGVSVSLVKSIELRVADSADELTTSLSDIAIVSSISANVTTVADSIDNVNTTAGSITNVNTTATNIDNVNTVGSNIVDVNKVSAIYSEVQSVANNEANVNTVATNIDNVNTVGSNMANINAVNTNETNINTVSTNINNINDVATSIVPSLPEILQADDNATIATTKASEAEASATSAAASALEAQGYANSIDLNGITTQEPIVTISTTINENTTVIGSIDNYSSDTNYTITANSGSVSVSGSAITYTAPDITDGNNDTDVIGIYCVKAGYLTSTTLTIPLTIVYVSIKGDDAYEDLLVVDDSTYNDGWSIV